MTTDKSAGKTAWWSEKMAAHMVHCARFGVREFPGHAHYELDDGRVVKVTSVTESPDDSGTRWDDVVKLGTVRRFVGLVR